MTSQKDRYADIVRRGIEKSGADDPAARQVIYERLRAWNEQVIAKRPDAPLVADDLRRQLDDAILEYEGSQIPAQGPGAIDDILNGRPPSKGAEPMQDAVQADRVTPRLALQNGRRGGNIPILAALVAGIAVGAGATYFLAWPANGSSKASVEATRPMLEATKSLLGKVRTEVMAQQKADPVALTAKAGDKFVRIKDVAPALQKEEADLPGRAAILIRADKDGYKVIAMSPLCTAAKLLEPELVDPVRDRMPFVCNHFGYWNEAGKKF